MRRGGRAALLLILSLLLPTLLLACATPGDGGSAVPAPDGMVNATPSGAGYALFLPEGWTVDSSTGVTIAVPSSIANATLTFAAFASDSSASEYWAKSRTEIADKFTDFTLDEEGGTTLINGAGALRYVFSGKYYTGTAYKTTQWVTKKAGVLYVFTYTAATEEYDSYAEWVTRVIDSFLFLEGTVAPGTSTPGTTEGAPAGMQDLSDPAIHDYRFYVPLDWVPDLRGGIVSAYAAENDRASVSVTCNYPGQGIYSIADYWKALQPSYKHLYSDYTVLREADGSNPVKIAGRDGAAYEFSGTNGGVEYRVMQIIFVQGSYIYTFTYTASAASYDTHLATVETIISSMEFV